MITRDKPLFIHSNPLAHFKKESEEAGRLEGLEARLRGSR